MSLFSYNLVQLVDITVILYYVIIKRITLQYCGKTQCKLYRSNGVIVVANSRLAPISYCGN